MIPGVLKSPRATLEVVVRERRVWPAAVVVAVWAFANGTLTLIVVLGSDLRAQLADLPPDAVDQATAGFRIFAPVSAFLLPFLWWIGVSAMMLLATRLFGGRPDYPSMLAAVGAASVPWIAGYAVQVPIGVLQVLGQGSVPASLGTLALFVSLASLVWHAALVVIGVRFAAGTSYRGAGGSCALAGLGCLTAGVVLGITVLTLVFVLSGAV